MKLSFCRSHRRAQAHGDRDTADGGAHRGAREDGGGFQLLRDGHSAARPRRGRKRCALPLYRVFGGRDLLSALSLLRGRGEDLYPRRALVGARLRHGDRRVHEARSAPGGYGLAALRGARRSCGFPRQDVRYVLRRDRSALRRVHRKAQLVHVRFRREGVLCIVQIGGQGLLQKGARYRGPQLERSGNDRLMASRGTADKHFPVPEFFNHEGQKFFAPPVPLFLLFRKAKESRNVTERLP